MKAWPLRRQAALGSVRRCEHVTPPLLHHDTTAAYFFRSEFHLRSCRSRFVYFGVDLQGGETISEHGEHPELICRGLHAGLARCPDTGALLFSSPPDKLMAVSVSRDDGESPHFVLWCRHNPQFIVRADDAVSQSRRAGKGGAGLYQRSCTLPRRPALRFLASGTRVTPTLRWLAADSLCACTPTGLCEIRT